MKENLNVSLVQFNPLWENKQENMRMADNMLKYVPFAQDMIVFPEMFLTGFSMNIAAISENMQGEMVQWMKKTANRLNSNIIGSLPIIENNHCYNRLIISSPDNQIVYYDKHHLFRMGEEPKYYSAGNSKILFQLDGWSVLPLVCYDLRFPVWSRNKNLEFNTLLYVANWPAARNEAFLTLLKARAIENSCYVIGVNRVGVDGNNLQYLGNSVVFNAKGLIVAGMIESKETIIHADLSLKELNDYRQKFPVHLDGDDFNIL